MYPITNQIFLDVYTGVLSNDRPYQSGKTSFLWALGNELGEKPNISSVYFEMSGITGLIDKHSEHDGFFKCLSLRIFHEPLDELELVMRLDQLNQHHCLLIDEFQYIFNSVSLLAIARDFFRALGSNQWVSYVTVGTYKLMDLPDDTRTLVSPFNKAQFLQMPMFSTAEMTHLFEIYRENINPEEIEFDLQSKIMFESGGHAASYMILLKLYDELRPEPTSWTLGTTGPKSRHPQTNYLLTG
jgi:hypothetical protein